MKTLLIGLLLFTACKKEDPKKPTVIELAKTVLADAVAGVISQKLECSNLQAIKEQSYEWMGISKSLDLNNIVCDFGVNQIVAGMKGAVPAAWECKATLASDLGEQLRSAICKK